MLEYFRLDEAKKFQFQFITSSPSYCSGQEGNARPWDHFSSERSTSNFGMLGRSSSWKSHLISQSVGFAYRIFSSVSLGHSTWLRAVWCLASSEAKRSSQLAWQSTFYHFLSPGAAISHSLLKCKGSSTSCGEILTHEIMTCLFTLGQSEDGCDQWSPPHFIWVAKTSTLKPCKLNWNWFLSASVTKMSEMQTKTSWNIYYRVWE